MSCLLPNLPKTLPDMQGHAKVCKNNSTSRNIQTMPEIYHPCISTSHISCKPCSHHRHDIGKLQFTDIPAKFHRSQGLSAGSFQQGFLNSDPWANWLNQRQAQEFYNQQLLLQQQFRNVQSVPVPPSMSSTPGNQGPVYQGQGFGSVGRGDSVTLVTRMLQQLSPVELQSVLQSVGQVNPGFKSQDLGDLYDDVGLLPGPGLRGPRKVKVVANTCSQEMRSGLVIPPQSIIKLGSLVKRKFWVGAFISRNFQVGPHKGRLNLEGRSN